MKGIKKIFTYKITNWETGEIISGTSKAITFEEFYPFISRMFNDFKDSKDFIEIELFAQYRPNYKEGDLF